MENLPHESIGHVGDSKDMHQGSEKHVKPQLVSYEHLKELRDTQLGELANSDVTAQNDKLTLEDTIPYTGADMSVEDEALERPRREYLEDIVDKYLPEREKQILYMRFGLDSGTPMTLQKISEHFGVSSVRISQLEKKALKTLKQKGGNLLREVWEEDGRTTWGEYRPLPAIMDTYNHNMGVSEQIKLSESENSILGSKSNESNIAEY